MIEKKKGAQPGLNGMIRSFVGTRSMIYMKIEIEDILDSRSR